MFTRSTISVGNGKVFEIVAENCSKENKYIQRAELNGKEWNRPWLSHDDIKNGGCLVLVMGNHPNKNWGSAPEMAPPSAAQ